MLLAKKVSMLALTNTSSKAFLSSCLFKLFGPVRAVVRFLVRTQAVPTPYQPPTRFAHIRTRPPSWWSLKALKMNSGYNPIAMLAERACGPIYNAIDTGNNSLAVRHADKVLQSQPDLALALALKALALVRSGKRDEANPICTKLVARGLRPGEDNALNPLTWTLGRLGRTDDEVTVLEAAVKSNPNDESLARLAFFALTKNQAFQKAQQLALKMHKTFTGRNRAKGRFVEEYFWWSILSYLLLARDPKAPGAALALPLSQRMVEKQIETKPLGLNDEEALCLLLQVLIRQGKKKDAFDLIAAEGSVGHTLCDRNLSLEFTRTDLAKELENWTFVEESCWTRIDSGSRNWAHFTGFLDAAEKLGKDHLVAAQKKINVLLSVKGATKDRSIRSPSSRCSASVDVGDQDAEAQLAAKVVSYFDQFASKACCHEDLLPYLSVLSASSRASVSERLREKIRPLPVTKELDLRTNISIAKVTTDGAACGFIDRGERGDTSSRLSASVCRWSHRWSLSAGHGNAACRRPRPTRRAGTALCLQAFRWQARLPVSGHRLARVCPHQKQKRAISSGCSSCAATFSQAPSTEPRSITA